MRARAALHAGLDEAGQPTTLDHPAVRVRFSLRSAVARNDFFCTEPAGSAILARANPWTSPNASSSSGRSRSSPGSRPARSSSSRSVATEERHALGTKIFQHGDPGDKLYIILEGKVRISRDVPGMGEEALAVLGPGAVFGEMALLDEAPRSADARVHERCRLLALPKDAFEDLLFLHKDLAYEVLWSVVRMLTQRLRETNDKLTFLSVTGKFE